MSKHKLLALADAVLRVESDAINALRERLDDNFVQACELLLECKGRVVVIGLGKSGHIARKLAATFASTGTAAFFVHPSEASHGDLGMIQRDDVVLGMSNSGETAELLALLPWLARHGIPLIAMTGNPASNLSRAASVHLDVSVSEEACPLGLAPTASTTATLAMGDALAVALLEARGFTAEDFARSHPSGALGKRLLLKVADTMITGDDIPWVSSETTIDQALLEMTRKGLGMTIVSPDGTTLLGVFTDGDLRRTLDQRLPLHQATVAEAMTSPCQTADPEALAATAVKQMEDRRITALPVLDDNQHIIGVVHLHALLRAGVG